MRIERRQLLPSQRSERWTCPNKANTKLTSTETIMKEVVCIEEVCGTSRPITTEEYGTGQDQNPAM